MALFEPLDIVRARMLCSHSTANISPVMKVANWVVRFSSRLTHLLWAPGRTNSNCISVGFSAPMICVSSPRITSGTPAEFSVLTPGTMTTRHPFLVVSETNFLCQVIDACGAGHIGRFEPSPTAADHARSQYSSGFGPRPPSQAIV